MMKRPETLFTLRHSWLRAALWTAAMVFVPTALGVEVGDPAPNFILSGSDGKTHELSDYLGHRPVVLAFFPKAFTGG